MCRARGFWPMHHVQSEGVPVSDQRRNDEGGHGQVRGEEACESFRQTLDNGLIWVAEKGICGLGGR